MPSEEWLNGRIKGIIEDIEYHEKEYKKEVERCGDRSKWLSDLYKSLEGESS